MDLLTVKRDVKCKKSVMKLLYEIYSLLFVSVLYECLTLKNQMMLFY